MIVGLESRRAAGQSSIGNRRSSMSDHDALYRAILANPDDDTPRLVYADWLQENGRPEEAELIRVECQLEATTPDDPEYTVLFERQVELGLWLSTHVPGPE